ncbi:hypothetical protein BDV96DRAFT_588564 [Lophiotrema nucula]|uniref:DUF7025 domain-containing protein n=1 Tax=Lophiotrema nucula TaxID=690887 RepID=A0A6A5YK99_9PLEO|nr:hypothetical protein BDV96DRAFT_588564 [Lophiotrema nucula]
MTGSVNGASENGAQTLEQRYVTLEQKYIKVLEEKIELLEKLAAKDKSSDDATIELKSPTERKRSSMIVEPDWEKKEEYKKDEDKDGKTETNGEARDEDTDENPRIKLLDSRWDEKTGTFEEVPSKLPPKNKAPEPSFPFAFTWLRKFDIDRKYETTKATINSEALEALIKDTCRASSSSNFKTFAPNFDALVWAWDDLTEASHKDVPEEDDKKKQARKDLELLLDQVKASQELQGYFEKRASWIENKEISYDYLWTLFPPGEMVCSQVVFDHSQAFIAREYEFQNLPAVNGTNKEVFNLVCFLKRMFNWPFSYQL